PLPRGWTPSPAPASVRARRSARAHSRVWHPGDSAAVRGAAPDARARFERPRDQARLELDLSEASEIRRTKAAGGGSGVLRPRLRAARDGPDDRGVRARLDSP